jgi:hypothetical protein
MGNPVTWFEVVGKDGPALQGSILRRSAGSSRIRAV